MAELFRLVNYIVIYPDQWGNPPVAGFCEFQENFEDFFVVSFQKKQQGKDQTTNPVKVDYYYDCYDYYHFCYIYIYT